MNALLTAKHFAGAIAAFIFAGLPLRASAWGTLLLIDKVPAANTLATGASVWSLPTYPGAHASRLTLLPAFDFYSPTGLFASTDLALGWNGSKRDDIQAGVRLWPQFGRRAGDAPAGLSRLGDRVQTEGFLNYQVLPSLLMQSGLSYGAGPRHDGAQMELGATSGVPIGSELLAIGVATTYANHAYRQSYFGVGAAESAASGLAATAVPAGWHDASLTFSTEHKLDEHWKLDGQLVVARLLGAAARSPVTQSRNQMGATVSLWYGF